MVVDVFPELGEPLAVLEVEANETAGGIFQVDWSPTTDLGDGTKGVRVSYATFETIEGDYREVVHIVDLIYDPVTGNFMVDPALPDPLVLDAGPGSRYWQGRFSPDGLWLVLSREDESPLHHSIWLASATDDFSEPVPLIDEPGVFNWYPAWSPDGSQLAFVSDRDGQRDIYGYDFGEGSIQRLTATKGVSERWLTWSPDGGQIAFRGNKKPRSGIMKLLDTGEQFELGSGQWPDWSPMDLPPLP